MTENAIGMEFMIKKMDEVSWFQKTPSTSIELIKSLNLDLNLLLILVVVMVLVDHLIIWDWSIQYLIFH